MPQDDFDIDAYLARISLSVAGPPSLALLRQVISGHSASIPFENLDIVLGRPIRLDIASLQAKLVDSRRGGYCFEQNTLLRAALERMGFGVTGLMARVIRGAPANTITPRTHMLLRVDLPEGPFLADVGFGNLTPTAPLSLLNSAPQSTEHEDYRLQSLEGETLLQARLGDVWKDVYQFSDAPSYPIDHEVANWFTSTYPNGLFTANVISARPGPAKQRTTLFNQHVTARDSDHRAERKTVGSASELDLSLRSHFGIALTADEVATVHAAVRQFSRRPEPGPILD